MEPSGTILRATSAKSNLFFWYPTPMISFFRNHFIMVAQIWLEILISLVVSLTNIKNSDSLTVLRGVFGYLDIFDNSEKMFWQFWQFWERVEGVFWLVSTAFTMGVFGILPILIILREGFLRCLDSFVSFKSFDKFDVCWWGGAGLDSFDMGGVWGWVICEFSQLWRVVVFGQF